MLDPLDCVDGSEFLDDDVVLRLSPPIMRSFGEFSNVPLLFSDSFVVA